MITFTMANSWVTKRLLAVIKPDPLPVDKPPTAADEGQVGAEGSLARVGQCQATVISARLG